MLEREGHAGGIKKKEWLSSTFAGCRIWRPWSRTFFRGCQREKDKFGCCCPPCPCCHVSMEMREGQDVPHSDYLGGWQGRHLVNILPSIATQHTQLSPADPQARCLLHSLPFWSQHHAKWTSGRAAGSLLSQVLLATQLDSECVRQPQQSSQLQRLREKQQLHPHDSVQLLSPNICAQTKLKRT